MIKTLELELHDHRGDVTAKLNLYRHEHTPTFHVEVKVRKLGSTAFRIRMNTTIKGAEPLGLTVDNFAQRLAREIKAAICEIRSVTSRDVYDIERALTLMMR